MQKTILVLLFLPSLVFAGAKAELWERWVVSEESSTEILNHDSWQNFLDTYRRIDSKDQVAKIRYSEVSSSDKSALDNYISMLESHNVDSLNTREQFAYWVNLYNATTVQLILNEYPITSIRRISEPWDTKLLTILGEELSLNDIEHRILRPRWKDPRIHFVVNCASIGCPDIPSMALSASNSEEILETSTKNYLDHPRGVQVRGRNLVLSSIFDWYKEDFGSNRESILAFVDQYIDLEGLIQNTNRNFENITLRYEYDWNLNEP